LLRSRSIRKIWYLKGYLSSGILEKTEKATSTSCVLKLCATKMYSWKKERQKKIHGLPFKRAVCSS
ncbi:mCG2329, partial [Mus musculus]